MNTQHTPGPWEFLPDNGDAVGALVAKTGWVCDFLTDPSPSNARLIAAAPDLLELLIELVDIEGPQPGTSAWGEKARAAIAKATGGRT
jgi:hypothetical protein